LRVLWRNSSMPAVAPSVPPSNAMARHVRFGTRRMPLVYSGEQNA
jgi:hypothetical protein